MGKVNFKKVLPDTDLAAACMAAFRGPGTQGDQALAEIALGSLAELAFQKEPSKPLKLTRFQTDVKHPEWDTLSPDQRKVCVRNLHSDEGVDTYLKQVNRIAGENASNATALEDYIRTWKKVGDADKEELCMEIYEMYPDQILYGKAVIWRKKRSLRR